MSVFYLIIVLLTIIGLKFTPPKHIKLSIKRLRKQHKRAVHSGRIFTSYLALYGRNDQ